MAMAMEISKYLISFCVIRTQHRQTKLGIEGKDFTRDATFFSYVYVMIQHSSMPKKLKETLSKVKAIPIITHLEVDLNRSSRR